MQLVPLFAFMSVCVAVAPATGLVDVFNMTHSIILWTVKLHDLLSRILLICAVHDSLPPNSDVLLNKAIIAPDTAHSNTISDVPRVHVVVFGVGGVLPDFDGPFKVDTVYLNKQWGAQVYPAVWVGYFGDRKVAVGADPDTTYNSICELLLGHQTKPTRHSYLVRHIHEVLFGVDELVDSAVRYVLRPCDHYIFSDHWALAAIMGERTYALGILIHGWFGWFVRWNVLRCLILMWPRPSAAMTLRSNKLDRLEPHNWALHQGLAVIEFLSYILFTTPMDLWRMTWRLTSTPFPHSRLWRTMYCGHRRAMLQSCAGFLGA